MQREICCLGILLLIDFVCESVFCQQLPIFASGPGTSATPNQQSTYERDLFSKGENYMFYGMNKIFKHCKYRQIYVSKDHYFFMSIINLLINIIETSIKFTE